MSEAMIQRIIPVETSAEDIVTNLSIFSSLNVCTRSSVLNTHTNAQIPFPGVAVSNVANIFTLIS